MPGIRGQKYFIKEICAIMPSKRGLGFKDRNLGGFSPGKEVKQKDRGQPRLPHNPKIMSRLRSYRKILLEPAMHRIFLTKIFFVAAFLIFLLSGHSWERGSVIDIMMSVAGLTLIMVCISGRIWCSLYLSGKKTKELVIVGPYSLTRNPIYLFNLIGALGLGLGSQNLMVLTLIAIAFGLFYPSVFRAEERLMEEKHGEAYHQYTESVPRFFPRTFALQEPEKLEVNPRKIRKIIMESMWFVWIFIIMAVIETLKKSGILPVLWRIP